MACYFMCGPHPAGTEAYAGDPACVFWPRNANGKKVGEQPRGLKPGRNIISTSRAGCCGRKFGTLFCLLSVCSLLRLCIVCVSSVRKVCLVCLFTFVVVVDCFLLIVFCSCLWYCFDLEWVPSGFPVGWRWIWRRFGSTHVSWSHSGTFLIHINFISRYPYTTVCYYEVGFHRCVWVLLSYQHDQHEFKLNCLAFI